MKESREFRRFMANSELSKIVKTSKNHVLRRRYLPGILGGTIVIERIEFNNVSEIFKPGDIVDSRCVIVEPELLPQ